MDLRATVVEMLPKLLPGLLVPLAQYVWQHRQKQRREIQIRELREEIVRMNAFLSSPIGIGGETEIIRQAQEAAVGERDAALRTLARLSRPAAVPGSPQSPAGGKRPKLKEALLLYPPSGGYGWVGRAVFFMSLTAVPFGIAGSLTSGEFRPSRLYAVFSVFGVAAGIGWMIARFDGRAPAKGRKLVGFKQRWLLMFKPGGILGGIIHLAYYLLAAMTALGMVVGITMIPSDPDWQDVILGYAILGTIALLVRIMAISLAERRPADADPASFSATAGSAT